MASKTHLRSSVAAALMLLSAGCGGGLTQVSGRIVDASGSPMPGVQVVARQESESAWASGTTAEDGAFTLSTPDQGSGLPPGDYGVVLSESGGDWDRPSPKKIPPKYSNAATSGVSFSAVAGENVVLDIVVKK